MTRRDRISFYTCVFVCVAVETNVNAPDCNVSDLIRVYSGL